MALPTRIFGYARDSEDPRVPNREAQKTIIEDYCQRLGRRLDFIYVDTADAGNEPLLHREAGKRLMGKVRRGDHVVVARLDRLARSLKGFGVILDLWTQLGISVHLCDMPMTVVDPNDPHCGALIKILVTFAQAERNIIGRRTARTLTSLKAEGKRYSRFAPYGFQYQRQGKNTFMVPAPRERQICARVAEMRLQGYSIDQIRQYLNYSWRVRNRAGKEFRLSDVHTMSRVGLQWLGDEARQGTDCEPGADSQPHHGVGLASPEQPCAGKELNAGSPALA